VRHYGSVSPAARPGFDPASYSTGGFFPGRLASAALGVLVIVNQHGAETVRSALAPHVGLVYLGLEHQRTFASNTLRGVSDDARAVITPLVAWIRDAPVRIGLGAGNHVPTALAGR
jgi:hypothetical protein